MGQSHTSPFHTCIAELTPIMYIHTTCRHMNRKYNVIQHKASVLALRWGFVFKAGSELVRTLPPSATRLHKRWFWSREPQNQRKREVTFMVHHRQQTNTLIHYDMTYSRLNSDATLPSVLLLIRWMPFTRQSFMQMPACPNADKKFLQRCLFDM